jgi:hypothetical protein
MLLAFLPEGKLQVSVRIRQRDSQVVGCRLSGSAADSQRPFKLINVIYSLLTRQWWAVLPIVLWLYKFSRLRP